ncbi:MAG: cupin domain-containing protein [Nanoarchaeota archaeon]|nr:cupin domain-containing protein [DPANN group archaeon]MBL7116679.1 cupin domain-containing protein [Nanoarchaeota archaeon]
MVENWLEEFNTSIESTNSSIFDSEMIKRIFVRLVKDGELSAAKAEPKMFFINLPAGFKGEEEVHEDEDDVYYVFDGEGELVIDRKKKITISKGDIIHIPAKQVHKLEFTKEGIKYIVVKK